MEGNGATINESEIEKYTLGFENKIIFINGRRLVISKPNTVSGLNISDFSDFKTKKGDAISQIKFMPLQKKDLR